jgi:uncharacterized membrane protein (DUF2068 family)
MTRPRDYGQRARGGKSEKLVSGRISGLDVDLASEFARQLKVGRDKKNKRSHDKGLLALALFKWFKGLVLLLVGVGFLKLLHHDIETELQTLVDALRVDPDNRYLGAILAKLSLLDDKKIEVLSGLTFAYSALFLVEGTGLFFEKRWAEYLTVVATVSFIPVEIYELLKAPSLLKCAALIINVAIAIFLIVRVRASNVEELPRSDKARSA